MLANEIISGWIVLAIFMVIIYFIYAYFLNKLYKDRYYSKVSRIEKDFIDLQRKFVKYSSYIIELHRLWAESKFEVEIDLLQNSMIFKKDKISKHKISEIVSKIFAFQFISDLNVIYPLDENLDFSPDWDIIFNGDDKNERSIQTS